MRAKTSEKNKLKIGEYLITTTATLLSKTPKKLVTVSGCYRAINIFSLETSSSLQTSWFLPGTQECQPCVPFFASDLSLSAMLLDIPSGDRHAEWIIHAPARKEAFLVRNHPRFLFLRPSPKKSRPRKENK